MTQDPGIDALNRWAVAQPYLAWAVKIGFVWAVLQLLGLLWAPIGWLGHVVMAAFVLILVFTRWEIISDFISERLGPLVSEAWARVLGYRSRFQKVAHEDRRREMKAEAQTALSAALLDTVDGDMQVATQRAAFNTEIARLLEIPRRTRAEEHLLVHLQRSVRTLDLTMGNVGALGGEKMVNFAGVQQRTIPREPVFRWRTITLGGPLHWYAIGALILSNAGLGVWGGFQHLRAERLESAANEARLEADEARAVAERNFDAAQQAAQQARQSAETIAAERRRARVEAQRARRRADVGQQIESGSAPDWGGILGVMQSSGGATAAAPSPAPDSSGVPSSASGAGDSAAPHADGTAAAGR